MLRHYFVSDSLDDLEVFEEQLEAAGVSVPQIHVLSRKDAEVANHQHLHEVQSFMTRDTVHSAKRGAVVGLLACVLALYVAYHAGWTDTAAGWMPFIFLAIVLLGFSTWAAGLLGIEKPNRNFARFEQDLSNGKHVFFVDLEPQQESVLKNVLQSHPQVVFAGSGSSAPHWLIAFQRKAGMVRHS
ncbi:MAG: hypothetical protein IH606_20970 [Burkholderiales bacterium]|nr:hypothetical protein [Burkholderiales bacterium]